MKAVISNFSTNKTAVLSKTLPVIIFFLIFCTSCKIFYTENAKNSIQNEYKLRKELVELSEQYIGTKYKYGGISPKTGFDCSGFTKYIFNQKNIILPHSSQAQSKLGKKIKLKNVKQGDLIFFKNRRKIDHVGIVVSNTKNHLIIIHSTTSAGVKKDDIYTSKYWKKKITFANDVISQ